eukprot:gene27110-33788_t
MNPLDSTSLLNISFEISPTQPLSRFVAALPTPILLLNQVDIVRTQLQSNPHTIFPTQHTTHSPHSQPFGVCMIQIKPQLEKVLNLSPDSLTKEIQLTQDLMRLFIEY